MTPPPTSPSCSILAATRLASDAERDLREGRWKGWGFGTHLARDVHGATLGLVGFGRIARAVAQRAAGFDMDVIHTTRHDTGLQRLGPDARPSCCGAPTS